MPAPSVHSAEPPFSKMSLFHPSVRRVQYATATRFRDTGEFVMRKSALCATTPPSASRQRQAVDVVVVQPRHRPQREAAARVPHRPWYACSSIASRR
jgi:hypothetical protein